MPPQGTKKATRRIKECDDECWLDNGTSNPYIPLLRVANGAEQLPLATVEHLSVRKPCNGMRKAKVFSQITSSRLETPSVAETTWQTSTSKGCIHPESSESSDWIDRTSLRLDWVSCARAVLPLSPFWSKAAFLLPFVPSTTLMAHQDRGWLAPISLRPG